MSSVSILHWWKAFKKVPATATRKRVLALESLEDRLVPSTLTVTNNSDAGTGSLRATIASASSGDTIVFAHSLAGQTINLTSGAVEINKNLDIEGLGANNLTISGAGKSRVFTIDSGMTATLANLTISNGQASTGGGIDNAGTLTLRDSMVTNNQAVGGMGGGGILNESKASLNLINDTLSNNVANAGTGVDVFGGGVLNLGSATVVSTSFFNNKALGGNGNTFFGGSAGGAIDNFGGANLMVSGGTFSNNQAIGAAGPFGGMGGAIENNAGLNQSHGSTAIISGTLFVGNMVTVPDGLGNGGAIDNQGKGATMTLSNSTLQANRSIGGNGATGKIGSEGLGGGIMNIFQSTLTVSNCTLTGNQAIGGNHGTAPATNPPNDSGQGGGIVNAGASLTVINSTLSYNQAIGGNTDSGPGGIATGGAIANWGPALIGLPSVVTIIDSNLTNNSAIAGHSGSSTGNASASGGFAVGGAIDDSFSGTVYVIGSSLRNNQAVGDTGGTGLNGGFGFGGAISVGFSTFLGKTDNSTVQVTGSNFSNNQAIGGRGSNGGDGQGGAIGITTGSSATVSNSSISQNRARGGAGMGGNDGNGVGGGVYNGGTFTHDSATTISKNHATTSNDDIFG